MRRASYLFFANNFGYDPNMLHDPTTEVPSLYGDDYSEPDSLRPPAQHHAQHDGWQLPPLMVKNVNDWGNFRVPEGADRRSSLAQFLAFSSTLGASTSNKRRASDVFLEDIGSLNFQPPFSTPRIMAPEPSKKQVSKIVKNTSIDAKRPKNSSSQYRGVSKCTKDGRWQVRIRVGNKVKYLGRFKDEKEAAICYDKAARDLHGEKALPNFPSSSEIIAS